MISWEEPPLDLHDGMWYGPYGAFVKRQGTGLPNNWVLCCPGCGAMGSPRREAAWTAPSGSFDDVTTLTLNPSIAKECCGWHGYLRNGIFESC